MVRLRASRWVVGLGLLSVLGVGACSALLGLDDVGFGGAVAPADGSVAADTTVDSPGAVESGMPDSGAADGPITDGTGDVRVNSTPEGDFEAAIGSACAQAWSLRAGAWGSFPYAHGGVASCRICVTDGGTSARVDSPVFSPVATLYTLEGYTHRGPSDPLPSNIIVTLRSRAADGGQRSASAVATLNSAPDAAWTRVLVTHPPPPGDTEISFSLEVNGTVGQCALFDDLSLTYVP